MQRVFVGGISLFLQSLDLLGHPFIPLQQGNSLVVLIDEGVIGLI